MTNFLVTGGAGNIGASLVHELIRNPANHVTVIDNLLTGSASNLPVELPSNLVFIKADVNNIHDITPVFCVRQFDYVFHYAAVVGVKRTLENPLMVLDDIRGIENILSLSKNTGVQRIFFSSSSEVYGEPFEIPQRENTTPLNSRLPYAIVKNVGEAFFRSYFQEYNLPYTIFRFFNTYSHLQSSDFVVARFVRNALLNQDICIYGDGLQTRTFCHVRDNIEFTLKLIDRGLGVCETFNVGSDSEVAISQLAAKIIEITHSSSRVLHLPALPEGDMRRRCPDISRMKKVLARDLTPLDLGIKEIIAKEVARL
jgi:UDP-glucuronate decarboxylase